MLDVFDQLIINCVSMLAVFDKFNYYINVGCNWV